MGFARQEYWSGSPLPLQIKHMHACKDLREGSWAHSRGSLCRKPDRVPGTFFPAASPLQHCGWVLGVPVLRISMVTFPGVVCSASKEGERLIMSLTKSCQFTAMSPVCKLKRRKASAQLSGHLVCPIVRHLRATDWICFKQTGYVKLENF